MILFLQVFENFHLCHTFFPVVAPNLDAVAVTTFRLRVTLSFLYSAVCSVVQCSVCKVVLPRVYVRLSWTFFQASSIAPIFTMADFAKMLSENHKTISTRIEMLNRLYIHYENKFTKTFRPTNILHIFTKFFFGVFHHDFFL